MKDDELKWWHVRWRPVGRAIFRISIPVGKVIGALCVVAAVGYGVLYLLAPWLGSQQISKLEPRVNLVPVDLPTKAESPLSKATMDGYGFAVRLPNEEISKTLQGDLATVVLFRRGGSLTFHNPSGNSGILGYAISDKRTEGWAGKAAVRSKFQLMQAALGATPEQAKWWRFRTAENVRVDYLLTTKYLILTRIESPEAYKLGPIYTVSTGGFRGFQIGNPDLPPYEAHLDLFDSTDQHLMVDVGGMESHGQVLTQAEVNAVVASIRPIAKPPILPR